MTDSHKDTVFDKYQQDDPQGARLISEPKSRGKSSLGRKKSTEAAEKTAAVKVLPEIRDDDENEDAPSVKTPRVLQLVRENTLAENQVIAAGKSRIPRKLRGIEPLTRVIRRDAAAEDAAQAAQNSPSVRRDLTGMIITQEAPLILKRFNACDCERCLSELARLCESEIPARYVTMPEAADLSYNGFTDEEKMLIDSTRKHAVSVMVRIMIGNKKRNFH